MLRNRLAAADALSLDNDPKQRREPKPWITTPVSICPAGPGWALGPASGRYRPQS